MRDTENGRAWAELLRSGRYKQGRGMLCTRTTFGHAYCCLGVAYEHVLGGDPVFKLFIPKDELDDLGIDGDEQSFCANMNDTINLTFDQIADVLERAMNDGVAVTEAYDLLLAEGRMPR